MVGVGLALAVLASACVTSEEQSEPVPAVSETAAETPAEQAQAEMQEDAVTPTTGQTQTTEPTSAETIGTQTTGAAEPVAANDEQAPAPTDEQDEQADPREGLDPVIAQATQPWPTDWSRRTIDLSELLLGIGRMDPRDAIPPIDEPVFETTGEAAGWLDPRAPGLLVALGGEARFYALSILHRHEIVNDEIGGIPVAVTYCPLCNTALTFDRRVGGEVLRFGVSGLLRNSDLVMWDDRSVSLWQQVTGEAIVGDHAGTFLTPVPTAIVSFGEFAEAYADGRSLSQDLGFGIPYGFNPYQGYSSRSQPYPFFDGSVDPRYRALDRVVGVNVAGAAAAYPFPLLTELGVVNDEVGGVPVAVFWGGDTADALDTGLVREGKAIGTGVAYVRKADNRELTFEKVGDMFRDIETGSTWTLLGEAISGPLAGTRLEIAVHRNDFWFAWGAFYPEGRVFEGHAA